MNKHYINQMKKAKKKGLSPMDLLQMKEIARKEAKKMESEATARAFLAQLAIPLNVLANDYWSKTAKRRAPKFIDDVLSLQDSWIRGIVTDEDLEALLIDLAGIKMVDILQGGIEYRRFKVKNYCKCEDHEEGDCSECGERLSNYGNVNFCHKCGTRVAWEVQE